MDRVVLRFTGLFESKSQSCSSQVVLRSLFWIRKLGKGSERREFGRPVSQRAGQCQLEFKVLPRQMLGCLQEFECSLLLTGIIEATRRLQCEIPLLLCIRSSVPGLQPMKSRLPLVPRSSVGISKQTESLDILSLLKNGSQNGARLRRARKLLIEEPRTPQRKSAAFTGLLDLLSLELEHRRKLIIIFSPSGNTLQSFESHRFHHSQVKQIAPHVRCIGKSLRLFHPLRNLDKDTSPELIVHCNEIEIEERLEPFLEGHVGHSRQCQLGALVRREQLRNHAQKLRSTAPRRGLSRQGDELPILWCVLSGSGQELGFEIASSQLCRKTREPLRKRPPQKSSILLIGKLHARNERLRLLRLRSHLRDKWHQPLIFRDFDIAFDGTPDARVRKLFARKKCERRLGQGNAKDCSMSSACLLQGLVRDLFETSRKTKALLGFELLNGPLQ